MFEKLEMSDKIEVIWHLAGNTLANQCMHMRDNGMEFTMGSLFRLQTGSLPIHAPTHSFILYVLLVTVIEQPCV